MDVNLPLEPPVNNNLQITLYDKLDQVTFEKIRVANTQLDSRLLIQERILNKHRTDIEKVHKHQSQRLRREVRKIRKKKPDYVFDDSDVSSQSRSRITSETTGRQRCLSEPPSNLSHCRRYYAHHFNVKDTTKHEDEKHDKRDLDREFCNVGLRLYFLNMMNGHHRDRCESLEQETNLGHSFDSRNGEGLPNIGLQTYEREPARHFNTQISSEDSDNDDVFDLSYTSFRSNINQLKQKGSMDRLTEDSEVDAVLPHADGTLAEIKTKRKRRRESTTIRRRTSKASDADIVQYGQGLRKTKQAFEELFSGLL